jgi:hypothetical protein
LEYLCFIIAIPTQNVYRNFGSIVTFGNIKHRLIEKKK